jgi:hypothetical protein
MAAAEQPIPAENAPPPPLSSVLSGQKKDGRANLRMWKPGQSGNPGGRPQFTAITDALKAELLKIMPGQDGKTVAEVLAKRLLLIAVETRTQIAIKAMEIILERTEGKVVQRQEISGPGGAPMQFEPLGSRQEAETQIVAIFQVAQQRLAEAEPAVEDPAPRQIEAAVSPAKPDAKPIDVNW